MKTDKMLMGSAIFFIICVLATLAVVLLSPKPPAASVAPVTAQASGNMPMMGPGMGSGMMGKGPMMGPGMGMMGKGPMMGGGAPSPAPMPR